MDKSIFKPFEVWFVTGSQHLYGPETLKQVAGDNSKKIIAETESSASSLPCTGRIQAHR
jgi:L-arabinose isomerase